jgi:sugar O-acyltransferase (sialic acid O-acetyltransferase NeuD family)
MSSKEEIILIGGGGHCKACIDVIEQEGSFIIKGIIDVPEKVGQTILGYPIIGSDNNLKNIVSKYENFHITIGFIKNAELRNKLFKEIKSFGRKFPNIISPKAYVSKHSTIGVGTIILHGAIINADAKVGNNCIINNQVLVEHDVIVSDNTHISTGAKINGECFIGENCFVGSGTIINHCVKVNSDIIIGSGSMVRKDIIEPGIYAGNPLRKIK